MKKIPIYQIKIPEYNVRKKPDHVAIGKKLDDVIKKHFMGKTIAIRALGSMEHKGKSRFPLSCW